MEELPSAFPSLSRSMLMRDRYMILITALGAGPASHKYEAMQGISGAVFSPKQGIRHSVKFVRFSELNFLFREPSQARSI